MNKHVLCVPASVLAVLAQGAPAYGLIFNDIDSVIQANRDRQNELMESSQAILNRAEAENRDLTAAEQTEVEGLTNEFDDLDRQIGLRERVNVQNAALTAPRGRQADPDPIDGDDPQVSADTTIRNQLARPAPSRSSPRVPAQPRATARGTGGFHHFGDFANSVRLAALGREPDARLRNAAASTIATEGVGADGGFAVPPDFRSEIATKVFGEDSLVARTDRMRSSSNSITLPTDMTTPWDSSGGIQAYWGGESVTMSQSKPKLEDVTYKAHKLHVLVPVSEELLEDAPAMDSYLRRKAPEKIDFKISDAIVRGTGAGQPLGFLNSPALVTQAAEGSQTADTINQANISKMFSRMPIASRRNAVWLIHPDAEPQLDGLVVGTAPIYMPPGGISEAPYGRLKGRPVIPHQVCETVGDLGDIILVDLNQYMTLTKLGGGRDENGLKMDVSMHLWFDQDLAAFKFTLRIGGQPWWSTTTGMRDGSSTMSPFVVLAAR